MSVHCSSVVEDETPVKILFGKQLSESTIEPPIEEWSSLLLKETPPVSPKERAFREGLYDPGSGEICAKYVPLSDSTVLNHLYYAYPSIKDPGIAEALTLPVPKLIYETDGRDLYLALCEEMRVIPVRKFHRSLVEREINLKYYCVNPVGVRAMCLSMATNRHVKRLDLTSNYLDNDACYHLGQLLKENHTLDELVLAQCKIGPHGIRRVVENLYPRTMDLLDLSSTDMGDEGFQYLATVFFKGGVIRRLNLRNNNLTTETALLFAEAIEFNNTITHLDISWNKIHTPAGSGRLLRILGGSSVLTELNFSWNSLTAGNPLKKLLASRNLRVLDLSNNRLGKMAAKTIAACLPDAKNLRVLDLSYNPLGPDDVYLILEAMKLKKVKLENLLMADIGVSKEFIAELKDILDLPYRWNTTITYGHVIRDYTLSMPDLRLIVMRRLDFLFARAHKKCQVDIALYFMEQYKARGRDGFMQPRELLRFMKTSGAPIEEGVIEELVNLFPGPKLEKGGNTIKLSTLVDYIKRLWPEKTLPPTPPPPPPPPPPKKKGKNKKKLLKLGNNYM